MIRIKSGDFGATFVAQRQRIVQRVRSRWANLRRRIHPVQDWLGREFTEKRAEAYLVKKAEDRHKRDMGQLTPPGIKHYSPRRLASSEFIPGDNCRADRLEMAFMALDSEYSRGDLKSLLSPNLPKAIRTANALRAVVVCSAVLDPDSAEWLGGVTELAEAPWLGDRAISPYVKGRGDVCEEWGHEAVAMLDAACDVLGLPEVKRADSARNPAVQLLHAMNGLATVWMRSDLYREIGSRRVEESRRHYEIGERLMKKDPEEGRQWLSQQPYSSIPATYIQQLTEHLERGRECLAQAKSALRAGGARPLGNRDLEIGTEIQKAQRMISGLSLVLAMPGAKTETDAAEMERLHQWAADLRDQLAAAIELGRGATSSRRVKERPSTTTRKSATASRAKPRTRRSRKYDSSKLTPGERALWKWLHGRVGNADFIAQPDQLNTSAITIRAHVFQIRRTFGKKAILNRPGYGYFRPDAPPRWDSISPKRVRRVRTA